MDASLDQVLTTVGPRLRALRQQHDLTLADLSSSTGISFSTLSRLESGQRRPTWNYCYHLRGRTRCRSMS